MNFQKKYLTILVSLTIFCLSIACNVFGSSQNEVLITEKEDYYLFDPAIFISQEFQENQENLFTIQAPLNDQSEMWSLPVERLAHWNQDIYFRAARVFNQQIGNDPLENWSFRAVSFDYDCMNADDGYERGILKLFKIIKSGEKEVRTVLTLDIMPSRKIIRRYEASYSPVLENWDTIDLSTTKISAEKAIEIAEKNGGGSIRKQLNNGCFIQVSLIVPGSGTDDWTVSYVKNKSGNSSSREVFKVFIDPTTGEFQTIETP